MCLTLLVCGNNLVWGEEQENKIPGYAIKPLPMMVVSSFTCCCCVPFKSHSLKLSEARNKRENSSSSPNTNPEHNKSPAAFASIDWKVFTVSTEQMSVHTSILGSGSEMSSLFQNVGNRLLGMLSPSFIPSRLYFVLCLLWEEAPRLCYFQSQSFEFAARDSNGGSWGSPAEALPGDGDLGHCH